MAKLTTDKVFENLRIRVLSALVLAPLYFAAIYIGSPYFDLIIFIACGLMTWEWVRVCSGKVFGLWGCAMGISLIVPTFVLYLGFSQFALAALVILAGSSFFVAWVCGDRNPTFLVMGTILIGTFIITSLWIRNLPVLGREVTIWLVLGVWFADMGGYFFGRLIGGPKMAPRVSPNKTWAGLGGGMLLALVWSEAWLYWVGGHKFGIVIALGVGVALLAQLGDLSISVVKRHFGVKDAGRIIPGHGGILDRIDGIIFVLPAIYFLKIIELI